MAGTDFTQEKYRLEALIAQTKALCAMTYGDCGEAFRELDGATQDNALWLLAERIDEIDTLSRRIMYGEETSAN